MIAIFFFFLYRLSHFVFHFTRLRNASLVFGAQVSRAGKRVCFRKVEYPPPNVLKFMPSSSLLAKMKPFLLVLVSHGLFGFELVRVGSVVVYVDVLHL